MQGRPDGPLLVNFTPSPNGGRVLNLHIRLTRTSEFRVRIWGLGLGLGLGLGTGIDIDSAEKPYECFDRLSMNGKISNDFNGSFVRSEALEG